MSSELDFRTISSGIDDGLNLGSRDVVGGMRPNWQRWTGRRRRKTLEDGPARCRAAAAAADVRSRSPIGVAGRALVGFFVCFFSVLF